MTKQGTTDKVNKIDPMAWWREARFGMFIHWGIYSAYEGYYKDQEQKSLGEWIQFHFKIPLAEYQQKAKDLTLENFDADFYSKIASRAGMRYMVLTSKHHDGFAMFDSKESDYNIVKMGPSHRDPLRELAEANARNGIKMCCYYSQSLDWADPNAQFNDWDYDPDKIDFDKFLEGKCKKQLMEILTQYGPMGLIWFDVPFKIDYKKGLALKNLVNDLQADCLVSGRISEVEGLSDYASFGDNQLPNGKVTGDWETAATLNHTWGYKRQDHDWKTSSEILTNLCILLSKGTNYLLNIGPKADGSIPDATINILNKIGDWMEINEEAVHGTEASPFPTGHDWGWNSTKGDILYLYVKQWQAEISFSGLKTPAVKASILGSPDATLNITEQHENNNHLHTISLPQWPDDAAIKVIKLQLAGTPEVLDGIFQQADKSVILPAYLAKVESTESTIKNTGENDGAIDAVDAEKFNQQQANKMSVDDAGVVVNWFNPANKISWDFKINKGGNYRLELRTIPQKYKDWIGKHKVQIKCAEQTLEATLKADSSPETTNSTYFAIRGSILGRLQLLEAGEYRLELSALSINQTDPAGLAITELILHYDES